MLTGGFGGGGGGGFGGSGGGAGFGGGGGFGGGRGGGNVGKKRSASSDHSGGPSTKRARKCGLCGEEGILIDIKSTQMTIIPHLLGTWDMVRKNLSVSNFISGLYIYISINLLLSLSV